MTYTATKPAPQYCVLEPITNSMYQGAVPVPVALPPFVYKGPKMPVSLWQQVLAWFKAHHKGEVMIRFFLDDRQQWLAIPFPQQHPTGMAVKEEEGHHLTPNTGHLTQFGSAHHHCTAAAFPSGTDNTDEKRIEGLHLIVGKVTQETVDLFYRLSVMLPGKLVDGVVVSPCRQVFIPQESLPLSSLFSAPGLEFHPPEVQEAALKVYVTQCFDVSYPKEWDTMLLPVVPKAAFPSYLPASYLPASYATHNLDIEVAFRNSLKVLFTTNAATEIDEYYNKVTQWNHQHVVPPACIAVHVHKLGEAAAIQILKDYCDFTKTSQDLLSDFLVTLDQEQLMELETFYDQMYSQGSCENMPTFLKDITEGMTYKEILDTIEQFFYEMGV